MGDAMSGRGGIDPRVLGLLGAGGWDLDGFGGWVVRGWTREESLSERRGGGGGGGRRIGGVPNTFNGNRGAGRVTGAAVLCLYMLSFQPYITKSMRSLRKTFHEQDWIVPKCNILCIALLARVRASTASERPSINLTIALFLLLTRDGPLSKNNVPSPLENPARKVILELRLNQPLPIFHVFLPRPPQHTLPRNDKLRAAGRHQVFRSRASKPSVPELAVYTRKLWLHPVPIRLVVLLDVVFSLGGAVMIFTAVIQSTAKALIPPSAHGSEVEVIDFRSCVCVLVPGFLVAVAEGNDFGEVVVVVDDEGEVAHGFVAFVLIRRFRSCQRVFFKLGALSLETCLESTSGQIEVLRQAKHMLRVETRAGSGKGGVCIPRGRRG